MLVVCYLFLLLNGVAAVRQSQASRAAERVEPFDLVLTITNKREVLDSWASSYFGWAADWAVSDETFTRKVIDQLIPGLVDGLAKKHIECDLNLEEVERLTARVSLQISGFEMKEVLALKSPDLASAIFSLQPILSNLGMEDQWEPVVSKVRRDLRRGLMLELPKEVSAELAANGIKVNISTDPAPPPKDYVERVPQPSSSLYFHLVMGDRQAIVDQLDVLIAKAAVRAMSRKMFLSTIQKKMKDEVVAGVRQQMGSALDIDVSTIDDADAGSGTSRTSFWMIVSVRSMDRMQILRGVKGDAFASNFSMMLDLLGELNELGADDMDTKLHNAKAAVDSEVLAGLATSLADTLRGKLGADVQQASEEMYLSLQEAASGHRCCATSDGQLFLVPSELLQGGGFVLGVLRRQGHCPKVLRTFGAGSSLKRACVPKGFKDYHKAVKSAYRPYTHCISPSGSASGPAVLVETLAGCDSLTDVK